MERLEAVVMQTGTPRSPRVVALTPGDGASWQLTVDFDGRFGSVRLVDRWIAEDDPFLELLLAILDRPEGHREQLAD